MTIIELDKPNNGDGEVYHPQCQYQDVIKEFHDVEKDDNCEISSCPTP